jgi:glycosyl hydrolase family 10/dockerin type I repeat protein
MAAVHANILICQVFGDAMALYPSAVAPRSHLVAGGFDALGTAVREGHRRGIEVHAYMNVLNVWSSGLGTPDPSHIVRAHPEWAVVDSQGTSDLAYMSVPDSIMFFCPEWDGMREFVVDVAKEIVTRYEVDGLHLDYLRFPGGAPRCFCSEHRRKFAAKFGRQPVDGDPDFIEWRFANITNLFGEIYDAAGAIRPEIKVSGSLIAPTGRYFQDAKRILEAGNLDIAMPMIYTADPTLYLSEARYFHENSGGRLVFPATAADSGQVMAEVSSTRALGLEGVSLFTWTVLDAQGHADIAALYPTPAAVPGMPWKDGTADVTPPVVSWVRAAGMLAAEATILWHTDEKARARVEFGPTAALGSAIERVGFTFEHEVRLTGLKPSTTYRYRTVSYDPSGNSTASAIATFATTADVPIEVVVDDGGEGFSTGGSWAGGSSAGGFGGGYLFSSRHDAETAWAVFRPYLPRAGRYEVSVWYVAGSNRVIDARHTVVHADGNRLFLVDQRSNGGTWNVLGEFRFSEGSDGSLRLSNQASSGSVVIADAVRFRLVKAETPFVRGDANSDGVVDLTDALAVLFYLFEARSLACPDALDANDSGKVDLTDAVYILRHLFQGGVAPPAPYPDAGSDPTLDALADC